MGITDLWLPPCSASVAPQGYLPSQLFNLDGSKYGNKAGEKSGRWVFDGFCFLAKFWVVFWRLFNLIGWFQVFFFVF